MRKLPESALIIEYAAILLATIKLIFSSYLPEVINRITTGLIVLLVISVITSFFYKASSKPVYRRYLRRDHLSLWVNVCCNVSVIIHYIATASFFVLYFARQLFYDVLPVMLQYSFCLMLGLYIVNEVIVQLTEYGYNKDERKNNTK